jgi:hypothetical protein
MASKLYTVCVSSALGQPTDLSRRAGLKRVLGKKNADSF